MRWRENDGVRWLQAELVEATAVFSTRVGGTSDGPFTSLNLGILTEDQREHVYENRRRLAAALGRDPAGVLFGRQVHESGVERAEARQSTGWAKPGDEPREVDGQATSSPELTPAVFVADCLPVALSGPTGVAMAHCGWRGLAEGIVARAVDEVQAEAAVIGPGIGPCCYEVGAEVLAAFAHLGAGAAAGRMLDLPEVAERALRKAGVEQVERAGICTSCDPELFFSHRRDDGKTGRQAGMVWSWPN